MSAPDPEAARAASQLRSAGDHRSVGQYGARDASRAIIGPEDAPDYSRLRTGVVTAVNAAAGLASVQLGGSSTASPNLPCLSSAIGVAVGAQVVVAQQKSSYVVLGALGAFDTGWQSITPSSGSGTLRWKYSAGWVFADVFLSGMTSYASGTIGAVAPAGSIPSPWAPASHGFYVGGNGAGVAVVTGLFNNDGSISALNSSAGSLTIARFSHSWPLGA